jgi:hypothetical protein
MSLCGRALKKDRNFLFRSYLLDLYIRLEFHRGAIVSTLMSNSIEYLCFSCHIKFYIINNYCLDRDVHVQRKASAFAS